MRLISMEVIFESRDVFRTLQNNNKSNLFAKIVKGFAKSLILDIQKQLREVFYEKKNVLKNLAKFPGKHLCQSVFFNIVADNACNFIKKRLCHRCFLWILRKFLRTPPADCFWIFGGIFDFTLKFHQLNSLLLANNKFNKNNNGFKKSLLHFI